MSEIVKGTTRRGQNLIEKASCNLGDDLYRVYNSFSMAKSSAFDDCKDMCEKDKGTNFRIISACRNNFSVAWELEYEGHPATRIETYMSSYIVLREEVRH